MSEEKKLNGTVIVTYRCNARCSMCNRYKAPSKPEEEISIETIKKLPKMYFTNITGGEPFIRTDLKDIVRELYKKSDRIVISTNGFFTDRIVDLCKEFPQIGIRISIEGLEKTNNEIRGLQNGYQRGYGTLKKLREMGMKDVGFGMTVQDKNAPDLVPLYKISDEMGMEFATASLHNSFYFVEAKNIIHDRPMVAKNFENLVNELLRSNSPKKWFRAYFNHGLINYIYGQKRLLPCDMSFDTFFIDPYGDVMPCNGTKDKEVIDYGEKCGLPVYLISYDWVPDNMRAIRPYRIEEFLSLIKYADTVFTASYHGMLFSLYFNKNFYYYNRGWKERMKSISEYLGLSDREHWTPDKGEEIIDYSLINSRMEKFREESKSRLAKYLGKKE